jgi:hypothetical protein
MRNGCRLRIRLQAVRRTENVLIATWWDDPMLQKHQLQARQPRWCWGWAMRRTAMRSLSPQRYPGCWPAFVPLHGGVIDHERLPLSHSYVL